MADVPSNLIPTRITQLPTAPTADENSLMMIVYQGNNYQIRVGDLLSVAGVPTSRQVIAGTGLTGGGQLSSNVTLSIAPGGVGSTQLAASGVTAGSYGDATTIPVFTVDATGRVVSASSVPVALSGYVPESRQVATGDGLSGGGALTGNLTLVADLSDSVPQPGYQSGASGVSTSISRADHKHPAVNLGVDDEVDGILGLSNGGTARSLVPNAGAVIWCGADGLYVSPAGLSGQVLVSGGTGAPTWGSALLVVDQPANVVYSGPASGPDAPTSFRSLVNADLPNSGVSANTYGSSTAIPVITVNAKGVVTGVTTASFTGGLSYQGGWNASTNTPTLASSTGTNSYYYVVTTAGSTNLDGITDWQVGDWAIFNGTVWQKIDQTNLVSSVNGQVGAVTLGYADVGAANSGTNTNVTSMTGLTGGIETPDYVTFDTTPETVPTAAGSLYWDSADGNQTLSLVMTGGNAIQQIGQEAYYRVRASSAITEGQVVMFTGTVGASGALTAAPATGVTSSQGEYIMGVATENIALNGWGYVTGFGLVRGINTTGGAEAWTDGQILYYDPTVTGGLTKNVPAKPNAIVQVCVVVHAASNGSLFVRPTNFPSLNGLCDVSAGSPTNGDLISWNTSNSRWQVVSPNSLSVSTASNLAGGAANRIPYQTGSGATSFVSAPVTGGTFLQWDGAALTWAAAGGGSVTSVALSLPAEFTVSGSPVTTSGTLTATLASQTANYVWAAPNGSAGAPTFRALVAADIPTLNQNTTGTASNVTGTVAVANGGTGSTTAAGARTGLGATTVGGNLFTLTNPSAVTFPRFNADNTVSALDAATFRSAIGAGTSSTTGTVTSVSGTGTVSGLTLTGTVTSTGNLTLGGTLAVTASNFASQTANYVLAAPNGTAGTPTFRALVAADIPTLNQNTTGTASNVTGTVAVANGGTGATTAANAATNLGLGTGSSVQFGSFGVGTAASGTSGEIRATNNVTAYYSSDRRLKENIKDISGAIEAVKVIGGKTFDWTDAYIASHGGADGYFIQKSDFGVIAQDVQAVFPLAVRTRSDGTLAVDYEKLSSLALAAIKELTARVEALEGAK